jgi:general secretion pathway protein G
VDEEYLYRIPLDPITKSSSSWIEVQEVLTDEDVIAGVQAGISDVKSGSDKTALDGTRYNTW